ncbi:integral membrane protein-like protein [Desulfofarcimen acetoxidans DSM 771]|uniref:Integral membrane protein-like protein n=1 Tax=Desulfofarcimen acetoxidans (strain ATCC 49208 / DSM 771 / KCTC 5769 / VKM B-1644 / 5575) TaxID=485916 RepID=C8W004_DESAS|nr:glycosyltransferase family 39 protein [Desulfofarcimen acetoxidans]ACV64972.1 integral membrane protein-like protein [Desulfofarcimen acetoxidans DSM 771]
MSPLKKRLIIISLLLLLIVVVSCLYHSGYLSTDSKSLSAGSAQTPPGDRINPPGGISQNHGNHFPLPDSNHRMGAPGGGMRGNSIRADLKYNTQLIGYSVLFLGVLVLAYVIAEKNKLRIKPGRERIIMLSLLMTALLARLCLAAVLEGHPFDLNTFKSWASAAADNLPQVYSGHRSSDYPPLYMYVLYLIGKTASISSMSNYYNFLLKLPSILADMTTAFLIYKLAGKRLSAELSVLLAAFYALNPAVLVNSTFWGQVDSFFTMLVFFAVLLLSEKKPVLAAAFFTAAVLMKPQGIIFLPVLFFEFVRQRNVKSFVQAILAAFSTVLIVVLPFSLEMGWLWIFKLFSGTLGEYPYASVNAFNFFALIGKNFAQDGSELFVLSYHSWGMIFIVLISLYAWLVYIKGNSISFASPAALLLIAGVFTFSTRMHERYLFPAVALSVLAFIYLKDKRLLLLAAGFSSTVYINTHYVLYETVKGINSVAFNPVLIVTSLLNVVLFVYLVKVVFDIAVRKRIDTCRC